jgi:hypothetical protein
VVGCGGAVAVGGNRRDGQRIWIPQVSQLCEASQSQIPMPCFYLNQINYAVPMRIPIIYLIVLSKKKRLVQIDNYKYNQWDFYIVIENNVESKSEQSLDKALDWIEEMKLTMTLWVIFCSTYVLIGTTSPLNCLIRCAVVWCSNRYNSLRQIKIGFSILLKLFLFFFVP